MSPSRGTTPPAVGRQAILLLLAGAVLISFSPVLVKLAHVGPTTAAFYRMTIGGVPLAAWVTWRSGWRWGGMRHVGLGVLSGAVLAADLSVWHRSIHYIGPGLATILASFQVFVVAAVAVAYLGERLTARLAVAIPLAVAGLFLIFGLEWSAVGPSYRLGFALGLLAAAFYAGYLLLLRQARIEAPTLPPAATVALLSLTSATVLAVLVGVGAETFAIPDRQTGLVLTAYGLGPQLVGWVLISKGLPGAPASRAALVLLLQPALAFVWDIVLFGRPTAPLELLGAGLALAAIYLGAVRNRTTESA